MSCKFVFLTHCGVCDRATKKKERLEREAGEWKAKIEAHNAAIKAQQNEVQAAEQRIAELESTLKEQQARICSVAQNVLQYPFSAVLIALDSRVCTLKVLICVRFFSFLVPCRV
jgi:septal ring factor EnvC (AmiA/AmiB activator)